MTAVAAAEDPDRRQLLASLQRQLQALDSGNEIHDVTPEVFRSVRLRLVGRQIGRQVRASREEQIRQGLTNLEGCLAEIIADLARRPPVPAPAPAPNPDIINIPRLSAQVRRSQQQTQPRQTPHRQDPGWKHYFGSDVENGPSVFWSPQPVLGFRGWQLRGMLHGVFRAWPEPEYGAGCSSGFDEIHDPNVPHTDGSCGRPPCGIYAYKDPAKLFEGDVSLSNLQNRAFGLVALRGKVVEHEYGYRGARALALAVGIVQQDLLIKVEGPAHLRQLFHSPAPTIARIIKHTPERLEKLPRGKAAAAQVLAFLDRAFRLAQADGPLPPHNATADALDPRLG